MATPNKRNAGSQSRSNRDFGGKKPNFKGKRSSNPKRRHSEELDRPMFDRDNQGSGYEKRDRSFEASGDRPKPTKRSFDRPESSGEPRYERKERSFDRPKPASKGGRYEKRDSSHCTRPCSS